jgi:quinol-cytochrome oxidoreductase complex cytochrome b subunit
MDEHKQIPIWFFIGGLLLVYGIIITAVGVYYLFAVHANENLALQSLHADLWWGIFLIVLGGFYTRHYFPWRGKK